jgi:hypothetical protein
MRTSRTSICGFRLRKTGVDQQQPHPCLLRRLRSAINELRRLAQLSQAAHTGVTRRDVGNVERTRVHQGVEVADPGFQR